MTRDYDYYSETVALDLCSVCHDAFRDLIRKTYGILETDELKDKRERK